MSVSYSYFSTSSTSLATSSNKCKLLYFISVNVYFISSNIFSLSLIYYNNPGWLKSLNIIMTSRNIIALIKTSGLCFYRTKLN